MEDIKLKNIKVTDKFWSRYMKIVKEDMIPFQWKVLNDEANIIIERERNDKSIPAEKSHAVENFKIAAGLKKGHHYGYVFQDSDVYKWLEAVAYALTTGEDKKLEKTADEVINLIEMAQEDDGYLDTYFTIDAKERKFKRLLESHELYCAGHFIEASVAYYEATGKDKVLKIACKLADCIDRNFGREEGKIHGYDGHEEIEIGLTKLYLVTKEERYLKLGRYFITERGKDSGFLRKQLEEDKNKQPILIGMNNFEAEYFQAHKPIVKQETAEGHAVRFVYMCTALAEVARLTGTKEMYNACKVLWDSVTKKRMYVTGGIGSTVMGERFTFDYDLPNDTMYCETCASVGLVFFAHNMLKNEPKGIFGDVLERSLYNSCISGMSLDGKHFFYVNPLEVDPKASERDPGKSHVKVKRPAWFGCACCPPNLARTLTSIGKYIYTKDEETIYTHLYISNESSMNLKGEEIIVKQETDYPWKGNVNITVDGKDKEFTIALRIPNWCNKYDIKVNEEAVKYDVLDGYAYISRKWEDSDKVNLNLLMEVQEIKANPYVKDDFGKVAIQRGPIVYCLEQEDNGKDLHLIKLPKNVQYKCEFDSELLLGVVKIKARGEKFIVKDDWGESLYSSDDNEDLYEEKVLTFIPYYSWANRNDGEMRVWIKKA
ncbi:glycoside hydrolase family 127 protein [Clostridium felsineum]|uniref:Non-reducing end beta-L-arabinofuranosidase n=1 Tax=Clostridium felsineum TaxID=36839 RepID=A0A1S8KZF1_9CLOT|nr:beta-L-arabinofuranosidase domain-containing protein [Clostridium felsineum]URZ08343.1 Non-reducing end beta-L-arabinofuranosidase [Clostridium felsineum]URZ13374.1 Non-reducing end beta-L-arabinofuranosidase [Clostridium felsineum]